LQYPYSVRWVLLSLVLVSACFILAFFALAQYYLLFLFYTIAVAFPSILVKYFLYRKLKTAGDNPLIPIIDVEGESVSNLSIALIVILVFLGFAFPFVLLLLTDPITYFAVILGFVAGINLPEVILYAYSHSKKIKEE
jgi:hypothetical protein